MSLKFPCYLAFSIKHGNIYIIKIPFMTQAKNIILAKETALSCKHSRVVLKLCIILLRVDLKIKKLV